MDENDTVASAVLHEINSQTLFSDEDDDENLLDMSGSSDTVIDPTSPERGVCDGVFTQKQPRPAKMSKLSHRMTNNKKLHRSDSVKVTVNLDGEQVYHLGTSRLQKKELPNIALWLNDTWKIGLDRVDFMKSNQKCTFDVVSIHKKLKQASVSGKTCYTFNFPLRILGDVCKALFALERQIPAPETIDLTPEIFDKQPRDENGEIL